MSLNNNDIQSGRTPQTTARPFIGVRFDCCGVYSRIYRRSDQREYRGRCPRCLRELNVPVGENGTSARIFRAE